MRERLLRVERPDGDGPFRSGVVRTRCEPHEGWHPMDGPGWDQDGIFETSLAHNTFLRDEDQLDWWFKAPQKATLHERGYKLAEYEVISIAKARLRRGRRQVAAHRDGVRRVALHDLVQS